MAIPFTLSVCPPSSAPVASVVVESVPVRMSISPSSLWSSVLCDERKEESDK